ncbi:MAG: hypothetical protein HY897_07970 [Deltaproteobacteria bacterium]|nr:hypothetical protein [Deltaproteobacteria bacterium]
MTCRAVMVLFLASVAPVAAGCYDIETNQGGAGLHDAGTDARPSDRDAGHANDSDSVSDAFDAGNGIPDSGLDTGDFDADNADSGPNLADAGPDTADAGADADDTGADADDTGPDSGCPDIIDHSANLPPGVIPPMIWFWRGIHQNNLDWYTDASGQRCGNGDTTMWFIMPNGHCDGAPSCDPDHFGTPESPCTGTDCCWRNWDDPRGPEFRVTGNTGPVTVVNWGARLSGGGKAEGYGFGVTICAAPGTTAIIDTCPRCDVHSCVETNYPQFVDQCDPVRLTAKPAKPGLPPENAGCYSNINDVTITF